MLPLADEKTFYMLGVIHRDKNNGQIVERWLNEIRPDVITIEFSQYGLIFRKEKGLMYRKQVESVLEKMRQNREAYNEEALSFLYAFIDLPGEYEAASRYCIGNSAVLYPVDIDFFSYMNLRKIDELFSEENIRNVVGTYDGQVGSNERAMARLFFDAGIEMTPYTEEMHIRDRYISRKINVLMRYYSGKQFAHITGWQHLKDPQAVFAPLHPVKVFPYD
ncbi:MAG: hypothetical protein C0399_02515 [Syntrophus sp. (in: bacteria)]|nr:hypothetical protein [Syntrophus sp. (in: bacteria)]